MSQVITGSNTDLASVTAEAEARYIAANPESKRRHDAAVAHMPGGNTRTVLFYSPYPVVLKGGEGCRVHDVDGHTYTDYLGEYTAGLYGHSNPVLQAALHLRETLYRSLAAFFRRFRGTGDSGGRGGQT